jgi:hypothetical protein
VYVVNIAYCKYVYVRSATALVAISFRCLIARATLDNAVGAALEACAVAGEYAKGLDLFDKLMQERNTGNITSHSFTICIRSLAVES